MHQVPHHLQTDELEDHIAWYIARDGIAQIANQPVANEYQPQKKLHSQPAVDHLF
jgi:hypothetical protein